MTLFIINFSNNLHGLLGKFSVSSLAVFVPQLLMVDNVVTVEVINTLMSVCLDSGCISCEVE